VESDSGGGHYRCHISTELKGKFVKSMESQKIQQTKLTQQEGRSDQPISCKEGGGKKSGRLKIKIKKNAKDEKTKQKRRAA